MKLERVWWCPFCNVEVVGNNYPGNCPECLGYLVDFGWRVGNGRWDYSYYSTRDAAERDRRLK